MVQQRNVLLLGVVAQWVDHEVVRTKGPCLANFQLKPGTVTVHPMALSFPTRAPDKLVFPTVHVHDGRFHRRAKFDHALYYQQPSRTKVEEYIVLGEPQGEVGSWMKPTKSYGELVEIELPMLRQTRRGRLWVG